MRAYYYFMQTRVRIRAQDQTIISDRVADHFYTQETGFIILTA